MDRRHWVCRKPKQGTDWWLGRGSGRRECLEDAERTWGRLVLSMFSVLCFPRPPIRTASPGIHTISSFALIASSASVIHDIFAGCPIAMIVIPQPDVHTCFPCLSPSTRSLLVVNIHGLQWDPSGRMTSTFPLQNQGRQGTRSRRHFWGMNLLRPGSPLHDVAIVVMGSAWRNIVGPPPIL